MKPYTISEESTRLAERYREMLSDDSHARNPMVSQISELGHARKHVEGDRLTILGEMLSLSAMQGAPSVECRNGFASVEGMEFDVNNAIYTAADEIASWRTGMHRNPANRRLHLDLVLNEPDQFEPPDDPYFLAGPAFVQTDDDIYLSQSDTITLVMDPLPYERDTFKLVTAYPSSTHGSCPVLEGDVTSMLKRTDAYKKADPFWQAVWEYKATGKPEDRPESFVTGGKNAWIIKCGTPAEGGLGDYIKMYPDGNAVFRQDGDTRNIRIEGAAKEQLKKRYPVQTAMVSAMARRIKTGQEMDFTAMFHPRQQESGRTRKDAEILLGAIGKDAADRQYGT